VQLFKLDTVECPTADQTRSRLQDIMDEEAASWKVVSTGIDDHLRVGDWISVTHPDFGTYSVRVRQIETTSDKQTITAGKRLFTASSVFGTYLRAAIPDNADVLSTTTLTNGAGSFVIKKEDVNDALVVYFEESYQSAIDDTSIDIGMFVDVTVNSKVVPPGRTILKDGGSVKVDITDQCNSSAASDTTNTVSRNLYRATGWTSAGSSITQWKALKFLAP
jgi:hypothetical protein